MQDNFLLSIFVTFFGTLAFGGLGWAIYTLAKGRKRKKLLSMRRQLKAQRERDLTRQHGVVRAVDMIRLSKEDDLKRTEGLRLIESGKVVEGARILELLGLQRSAISALENHHRIDEAAEMLLRMNRPNRAGVLYQRNQMPKQAAECFLLANLPDDAARCYFDAGKIEPECFHKCADLYENIGKIDLAIKALREGELILQMVDLAIKYDRFQEIESSMSEIQVAAKIIKMMDDLRLQKILKAFANSQENIVNFVNWIAETQSISLLRSVIIKIDLDPEFAKIFWTNIGALKLAQKIPELSSFEFWSHSDLKNLVPMHVSTLELLGDHLTASSICEKIQSVTLTAA